MVKQGSHFKNSLLTLLIVAVIYALFVFFFRDTYQTSLMLNQFISILYLWTPGIVALFFAKKENLILPIFSRPKRSFFLIPIIALFIGLIALVICMPFGAASNVSPVFVGQPFLKIVGWILIFFFISFLLTTLIFSFLFLGGELYWRGYLWEKVKHRSPLKAVGIIAILWILWQLPITTLTYSPELTSMWGNIGFTVVLNFILSPILLYFRLKEKSIYAAALFFSSMIASFLFFIIVFPMEDAKLIGLFGLTIMGLLVVFALVLKLFSPSKWQQLKNKDN